MNDEDKSRLTPFKKQFFILSGILILEILLISFNLNFNTDIFLYNIFFYGFLLFLPLALANAAPVILKKFFGEDIPLDFNKSFRKRRLFESRTLMGLFAFVIISSLFGQILFNKPLLYSLLGLVSFIGTCLNSFLKRQFGIPRGKDLLVIDQIDYLVFPFIILFYQYDITLLIIGSIWFIFFHFCFESIFGESFKGYSLPYSKVYLYLILLLLFILSMFTQIIANFIYIVFYYLIYGTSFAKTFLFVGFLLICLLPFKLKINKNAINWLRVIFLVLVLTVGILHYHEALGFNQKIGGNENSIAQVLTYDGSPLKYSATSLFHSHLFKSFFSFVPLNNFDTGKDFLPGNLSVFYKIGFILFFISALIGLSAILGEDDPIKRIKWFIISFGFLISSIDGGLVTPQFVLFLSLGIMLLLSEKFPKKYYWYLGLVPLVMFIIRSFIFMGYYYPTPVEAKMLFYFMPFIFLAKKRFLPLLLLFIISISLFHFILTPQVAPESSISFYGSADKFLVKNELVFKEGNVSTIRFYTNNSWDVFNEVYRTDKGRSYDSFISHMEMCYGIKLMETNILPEDSFNSSVIKIINTTKVGDYLNIQYVCACSDCSIIPAIIAKKSLNKNSMKLVIFYNSTKDHSNIFGVIKEIMPIRKTIDYLA
jgi:hypothetical protein